MQLLYSISSHLLELTSCVLQFQSCLGCCPECQGMLTLIFLSQMTVAKHAGAEQAVDNAESPCLRS